MKKNILFLFVCFSLFSCNRDIELKRVESENLVLEWAEVSVFDHFPTRMEYRYKDDSITSLSVKFEKLFTLLDTFDPKVDFKKVRGLKPDTDYDIKIYLKQDSKEERILDAYPELLELMEEENLIEISK